MTRCHAAALMTIAGLAVGTPPAAQAQDAPPSYRVDYLGPGSPTAINNTGIVVGAQVNGSVRQPLVSVDGAPWAPLPVPAAAMSVFPTDVNDAGVIVGVSFAADWNPTAVRWVPSSGGYRVEVLPRIPGDASSYALAIDNLGQIAGARRALGYAPTGSGWVYSDEGGIVDLAATYGWWSYPVDINGAGQVIGGAERLDLTTGEVTWIGNGPPEYNAVTGVAVNAAGLVAGAASLRSTSLNIVSVFRYEGPAGWRFIAGSSRYTQASSINGRGDVGYGELGAGVYLDGLGTYAVGELLDPAARSAGWTITGSSVEVNDARVLTTLGRNTSTGEAGGLILTPTGDLPVPPPPANLAGVPHPATRWEPYTAIVLSWENTSVLTRGYELQRRVTGTTDWVAMPLVPPGTATTHTDTTVGVSVTYDYRVRATGLGGASLWSNTVTVTAPAVPLDTTPPVVTITSPADGAAVAGTVTVTAQASDNVGVTALRVSVWNQYLGTEVPLGETPGPGPLSVPWNTAGLTPAAYTLWAVAEDALGNWSRAERSVTVVADTLSLRVASISLGGRASGTTARISGTVVVKSNGVAVPGASVAVRWTLPGGGTQTATAFTDSRGRAKVNVTGPRGTYTLTVTDVAKAGYAFDAASSVLTRSITK